MSSVLQLHVVPLKEPSVNCLISGSRGRSAEFDPKRSHRRRTKKTVIIRHLPALFSRVKVLKV